MKHLNYFSEKEVKHIDKLKDNRTKWLYPVARFFAKMKVTANMVSVFGFLMIFGFVYFLESKPWIAAVFLIAHIFIDGLDGTIARVMKKDGNPGAFLDIMCDHTGIIIATAALAFYSLVNGVIGIIYIYLYTIMIVFTIIRNIMKTSPKIVLRTKYYIYALYGIYIIWGLNYFNEAMIIFSAIMLISVFNDFFAIKKKLQ